MYLPCISEKPVFYNLFIALYYKLSVLALVYTNIVKGSNMTSNVNWIFYCLPNYKKYIAIFNIFINTAKCLNNFAIRVPKIYNKAFVNKAIERSQN